MVLAVAALGCDGGPAAPAGVHLSTDRATYAAGEIVAVTITNTRATEFRGDLCRSTLERRGGKWATVRRPLAYDVCLARGFSVPAGSAGTVSVLLPTELATGTYRWRFGDLGDRATPPFAVR